MIGHPGVSGLWTDRKPGEKRKQQRKRLQKEMDKSERGRR
jgi:hypothetical protein